MSDGLKPCPFCGDDSDKSLMEMFSPQTGNDWTRVMCRGCGASASLLNWNCRAQPAEEVQKAASGQPLTELEAYKFAKLMREHISDCRPLDDYAVAKKYPELLDGWLQMYRTALSTKDTP